MPPQALIRVRLSVRDARSDTGQVDPIRLLELFNDVATELAIREVGDEGQLRGYTAFDVLGPLRVGDYIEARGRVVDTARKTLTIEFVAHKVIRAARTLENPMGGTVIDPPRPVARATGRWFIPERVAETVEEGASAEASAAEEGTPAAVSAGEGETTEETAPLSWGGHRPTDAPREKRRPGSTVRMRPDDAEEERPARAERDAEEERYFRDRPYDRRGAPRGGGGGRGGRPYGDRPRDDRGRDDRGRGGRPYGERSRDDRGRDDRGRGGGRPYGERSRDDRGRDDRGRGGGRPYGERSRDDRGREGRGGSGGRPYGERSRDDRGRDDRGRGGGRPYGDRPREDRPREDRPPKRKDRDDRES